MRRTKRPNRMNRTNLRASALPSLYFTTYVRTYVPINDNQREYCVVKCIRYIRYDNRTQYTRSVNGVPVELTLTHAEGGRTNSSD